MKPMRLIEADVSDKPPVFLPVTDERLSQEALMHILRSYSDAVERLAKSSERRDVQHAEILKTLAGIETRLSVIESGTLGEWVHAIDKRLAVVEADQLRRQGREGVWSAILRSPVIAWFITVGSIIAGAWAIFREGGQ